MILISHLENTGFWQTGRDGQTQVYNK